MSVDACAGTGFVLAADLPLTDEEDEPDEEAGLQQGVLCGFSGRYEMHMC